MPVGVGANPRDFLIASDMMISSLGVVSLPLMMKWDALRRHLNTLQPEFCSNQCFSPSTAPPTSAAPRVPLGTKTTVGEAFDYTNSWIKLRAKLSRSEALEVLSSQTSIQFTIPTLKRWKALFAKWRVPNAVDRVKNMPSTLARLGTS
jgi:hypothetical protein